MYSIRYRSWVLSRKDSIYVEICIDRGQETIGESIRGGKHLPRDREMAQL